MNSRPEYQNAILSWLGKPVIKVLSGMRRVGKSTLLELIKPQVRGPVLHINMEWLENSLYRDPLALNQRVKEVFPRANLEQLLMIDEVQEIPGWERVINSLQAQEWCDIIVTGSNARVFSGELATLLSGRYLQIPVYPLSWKEYLSFRGIPSDPLASQDKEAEFYRWLEWGGLPGLHCLGLWASTEEALAQRREYLLGILDTVVLKDVIQRNQVRDTTFLQRLVRYAFDNTGRLFSAASIRDWMKSQHTNVSLETIQNYLGFLVDAQLIHSLPRADLVGKRILAYQEKLFLTDLGLRHALLGYRAHDISQLLENVVYLELLRRGYRVTVGQQGQKEVDFVAERQGKRLYIQVAYLLASPQTIEREFTALEAIADNYPKMVLTLDASPFASRGGILHQNLIDWLQETGGNS